MTADNVEGLRYSPDHCWARLDRSGTITVGLTDFAQSALGAIVFAVLPEVDAEVETNGVLGEVESTKAVSEVYAPVAGRVTAINTALGENPGRMNTDPYGQGWICAIDPVNEAGYEELLDAAAYAELTNSEPSTKD